MLGKVINESSDRITNRFDGEHKGIDLGWRLNELHNKVYAHSSGKVIVAVDGKGSTRDSKTLKSYGNYVEIDHENGYKTRYAHLRKNTVQVLVGQRVDKDTQLGVIGESGNVFGRHLHFEVFKNGTRINPELYLNNDFEIIKPPVIEKKYQSHDNVYEWNPNVVIDSSEYAGNFGIVMDAIYLDTYKMRVHDMVKKQWLPYVKNRNDYAGNFGNAIDGIQIEGVVYRAHIMNGGWLSWISKIDDTPKGYAGIYGRAIDAIQIK